MFTASAQRKTPRRTVNRRRAAFEALEDRRLFAAILVTNLADSGAGSLRDAIAQANANPGADTISFDAGLSGIVTLTSGQLQITDTSGLTTVRGPGSGALSISGNGASRVFQVNSGASAVFSGIAITRGIATSISPGGYYGGSGILNNGTLTVSNSILDRNGAAGAGIAGAMFNSGTLTINGSTLSGNMAGEAGAIWNTGTLNITASVISGNSARANGTIYNSGTLAVTDSTLAGNSVIYHGHGGGIYNDRTCTVTRCTFSGNSAWGGGGIFNMRTLIVSNSTFFGNTAVGSVGGGIHNNIGSSVPALITNCTFSGNSAASGGGGIYGTGIYKLSGKLTFSANLTINNSIVAGNTLRDGTTASDLSGGGFSKGSNNLIGTGGADGLSSSINIIGVALADLRLAPLGNYGGPTQTMALLAGSVAIDAGSNSLAVRADGGALTTDQRLFTRIVNGKVDIGAFEVQSG